VLEQFMHGSLHEGEIDASGWVHKQSITAQFESPRHMINSYLLSLTTLTNFSS
jgi:hypothetical protein